MYSKSLEQTKYNLMKYITHKIHLVKMYSFFDNKAFISLEAN